jgi:hypothetical protein
LTRPSEAQRALFLPSEKSGFSKLPPERTASCRRCTSYQNEGQRPMLRAFIFALLLGSLWLPILAEAKSKTPSFPERNPKRTDSKPKSLKPGEVETRQWTDDEVAAAKAECTATLAGVRLDFEPLSPIQQGLCGTPAPILLRSLGVDQKVELDPPATVSCDLAKALSEWVDKIQRDAEEGFGATIAKLRASSYACRTIYNRARSPLSQHALANAIDLSGFVLTSGELITVREDWDGRAVDNRSLIHLASAAISLPNPVPATQQRSEFVIKAHDSACSIFGTVLGPRANKAHRDHFHLDMKQRDRSFCR